MPPETDASPAGPRPLKIVYLTAGAAGMICGSCLHDNTLARALLALGHDVQLVPLYTPIRTDEEDVSQHRVFYGGINMYLQQRLPLFRWLPKWLDRWLDWPWLIDWAAGRSVKIEPAEVADLALSILRGTAGFQRKEVERLAEWLAGDLRPEVIVFSNILTAGSVPEIKRRLDVPVVVTLQGDDIFLGALPQPQQAQALQEIARLAGSIDAFIAHSAFYADAMAETLRLDREKVHVVPLGIDTRDYDARPLAPDSSQSPRPPTIGYLARLAPEKGLHLLAQAFIRLRQMPGTGEARLRIAGWLGASQRPYAEEVFASLRSAGLADAFEYVGEVNRSAKLDFLASLEVLTVPTTYREPKGLFVLEALAAGVPVVQPEHGAFPEVLAATQGGLLHRPEDAAHLAERLHELLTSADLRQQLAARGRASVRRDRNATTMALRTADVLQLVIDQRRRASARAGLPPAPAHLY
jgi:glycosyltransferase involved in cell wall biosynthesis